MDEEVLTTETVESIKEEIKNYIDDELAIGFAAPSIKINTEDELKDVYAERVTVNSQRSTIKTIDNIKPVYY